MKLTLLILLSLLGSCSTSTPVIRPSEKAALLLEKRQKKTEDVLRICAVGDTGNASQVQRYVAESMLKAGCDRLVILGDVIYPHGIDSAYDGQLAGSFREPYKDFRKIYIVLGNHDYQGKISAWKEIAEKDPRVIHPSNFFRERIHDLCLFFLDTNFERSPDLYKEQSEWLKNSMDGCRYNIGFSHHPYLSSGSRHGHARDEVKKFYEEHVIGKFRYVLSGHEHILSDEGTSKDTRLIIAGSGGKVDKGHRPGFAIIDLRRGNWKDISVEIVEL